MRRSNLGSFDQLRRLIEPRVDFLTQQGEIDRLGQQSRGVPPGCPRRHRWLS